MLKSHVWSMLFWVLQVWTLASGMWFPLEQSRPAWSTVQTHIIKTFFLIEDQWSKKRSCTHSLRYLIFEIILIYIYFTWYVFLFAEINRGLLAWVPHFKWQSASSDNLTMEKIKSALVFPVWYANHLFPMDWLLSRKVTVMALFILSWFTYYTIENIRDARRNSWKLFEKANLHLEDAGLVWHE